MTHPCPAIASDPESHYYAVIFTSTLSGQDRETYSQIGQRMEDLARDQPGFLGIESTRNAQGLGITISYWKTKQAIQEWKLHAEHVMAREMGRSTWYNHFHVRIAKVEREYSFQRPHKEVSNDQNSE